MGAVSRGVTDHPVRHLPTLTLISGCAVPAGARRHTRSARNEAGSLMLNSIADDCLQGTYWRPRLLWAGERWQIAARCTPAPRQRSSRALITKDG